MVIYFCVYSDICLLRMKMVIFLLWLTMKAICLRQFLDGINLVLCLSLCICDGETILNCMWCILEHFLNLMIIVWLCSWLKHFNWFSAILAYWITFSFILCYHSFILGEIFLWHIVDFPWWLMPLLLEDVYCT